MADPGNTPKTRERRQLRSSSKESNSSKDQQQQNSTRETHQEENKKDETFSTPGQLHGARSDVYVSGSEDEAKTNLSIINKNERTPDRVETPTNEITEERQTNEESGPTLINITSDDTNQSSTVTSTLQEMLTEIRNQISPPSEARDNTNRSLALQMRNNNDARTESDEDDPTVLGVTLGTDQPRRAESPKTNVSNEKLDWSMSDTSKNDQQIEESKSDQQIEDLQKQLEEKSSQQTANKQAKSLNDLKDQQTKAKQSERLRESEK
jgi:hypothetical protein